LEFFGRRILTVSELTGEIKDLLETQYDEVWVEGEVSNVRRPPSGHIYFTLKDDQSQIRAVLFKLQTRFIPFDLQDGQYVICGGRVGIYEKRGEYQLVLDYVEPKGVGSLQLAYEQLKERLAEEGLFNEGRKRPLPLVPRKVGIVTSPAGAVIRDVVYVLRRRFDNIEVLLYPVRVQGEGAAAEIAQGLEYLGAYGNVDVIIVGRGGGSLEDLWAFNEEAVARAIVSCPVPVISAVGHETDFTIADFAADVRAPTPSAAAEMAVREKQELVFLLQQLRERMRRELMHLSTRKMGHVAGLTERLGDPRRKIEQFRLRLDEQWGRLGNTVRRIPRQKDEQLRFISQRLLTRSPLGSIDMERKHLKQRGKELHHRVMSIVRQKEQQCRQMMAVLDAMNPFHILQRGYSITERLPERQIVRAVDQVAPHDLVSVRLFQGELICRVERKK
jgi:exodeoxyribonuclease VII large subunit